MARCKHLNCTLYEEYTGWAGYFAIENGIAVFQNAEENFLDLTGRIRIRCADCKKTWIFSANKELWPKWVKARYRSSMTLAVDE